MLLNHIPKIFYSYWDGNKLSYLQYLTIVSFINLNPDWKVKIYMPIKRYEHNSWITNENKDKYFGKDYFNELYKLNIEIIKIDFNKIGFKNDVSEVIKSDYLRYYLLGNFGGLWSDMDILYIKPINDIIIEEVYGDKDNINTVIDFHEHFSIGFLLSSPNNDFFLNLVSQCLTNYDSTNYQTFGKVLIGKLYKNIIDVKNKYPNLNILNINHDTYLPIKWNEINNIFYNDYSDRITNYAIGIHWFNGSSISKKFQNEFYSNNFSKNGTIYKYLNYYINTMEIYKLYLYQSFNNGIHRFYLSNIKKDNLQYITFINVFKYPNINTKEFFVYYSHNNEFCNISDIKLNDNNWNYSFNFFAYTDKQSNSSLINIDYALNPERCKISYEYPREGWINKLSFYVINDYDCVKLITNNIESNNVNISIVMSYYNRLEQLIYTLKQYENSIYKDIEVVIVNDASSKEHNIDDLIYMFEYPIKLINISDQWKKEKGYLNPCIPYNIGFKHAIGKKIIIQNPECCYVGDVIDYVDKNLNENDYFAFSCLSLDENITKQMRNIFDKTTNNLLKLNGTWYNHPTINCRNYHFTSAIFKSKLDMLGGFDEKYAFGYCYDDDEILFRIKKLGLNVKCISPDDNPFVIHQWHPSFYMSDPNMNNLVNKNKSLFEELKSGKY